MSRTKRNVPSSGCFMRRPHHKPALMALEASAAELLDEGLSIHTTRRAEPPTAYDDLIVSVYRGQPWARQQ